MFEYMNSVTLMMGIVSSVGILLIILLRTVKAIHENKKVGFPYFLTIVLCISVGVMIYEDLSTKERYFNNIKVFKENGTLRCHTLGSTYIVSKAEGWTRHKEGFTKDDLFFRLDFCEEEE